MKYPSTRQRTPVLYHRKKIMYNTRATLPTVTLFICLMCCMSTLHQDSSAPPLTPELSVFHALRRNTLDIAFSYTAPTIWNSLPCEIRGIHLATAIKTALKIDLLKRSNALHTHARPPPPPPLFLSLTLTLSLSNPDPLSLSNPNPLSL